MKQGLVVILALMPLLAVSALFSQGLEQCMLVMAFFGFSLRAYRLSEEFLLVAHRDDYEQKSEEYERQMKSVQTFTVACAFISFFWPESMFLNAAIFLCLVFHVLLGRYVKNGSVA